MNRFAGYQTGKTFLIGREDLIAALESLQAHQTFAQELRRRRRVAEDLERTREDLKARQVKLPVSAAAGPAHASSLPSGMRVVRPGVLESSLLPPRTCWGACLNLSGLQVTTWPSLKKY
jgi:hypothetical protein